MILLAPLVLSTLMIRLIAGVLAQRGVRHADAWSSWSGAAAAGMGVVFLLTGTTHFVEPQRSGLEAIVPTFIPRPDLVITLTGLAECVLALGLILPRTRRWAAVGSVLLLLALFPANVIAAAGVDNPAAPSTPLVPRALLQLVFLTFAAIPLFAKQPTDAGYRDSGS